MIGLGVGIVILAVTFGTLVAAGMPIVTAVVALVTGLGLIGLLGHVADIPVVAPTLATMLGLGVGIDYALFIVFRYRDELHRGANVGEAVARALATSGSAVVFAGVTVIIALLSLLVARVPLLGAMGWASALAVLVAVLTAITFLPAVLALVGRRIDALRLPWRRRLENAPDGDNIWARWAAAVTRHPWISLIASLLVMLPLAAPTLTLILGQEDIGAWPTSTTQRRAYDLVSAGLGPGANGRFLVATGFSPAAEPSAAYTQKKERAERLAGRLEMDAKRLKRQGKALERRAAAAKADRSALESRGAALTHLRQAGIGLAYPKQDVFHTVMPTRNLDSRSDSGLAELIGRIPLFEPLEPDELLQLAGEMSRRDYVANSPIIRMGDQGDSMFVLVEGLLEVFAIAGEDGNELRVTAEQIVPGQFFGEMSLLTGEPRSATVKAVTDVAAYEITKENMEGLLTRRPGLAERISLVVAARKLSNTEAFAHAGAAGQAEQTASLAGQILGKMKSFFKGTLGL